MYITLDLKMKKRDQSECQSNHNMENVTFAVFHVWHSHFYSDFVCTRFFDFWQSSWRLGNFKKV